MPGNDSFLVYRGNDGGGAVTLVVRITIYIRRGGQGEKRPSQFGGDATGRVGMIHCNGRERNDLKPKCSLFINGITAIPLPSPSFLPSCSLLLNIHTQKKIAVWGRREEIFHMYGLSTVPPWWLRFFLFAHLFSQLPHSLSVSKHTDSALLHI